MESDADARAYDELSRLARITDLAAIAHQVMMAAAEKRQIDASAVDVDRLATEKHLLREDTTTTFGAALDVLTRAPTSESERSLARALAAHAFARPPLEEAHGDRGPAALLWLAGHSPFDATGLLDRSLGDDASAVWNVFADRIRRFDSGTEPLPLDRAEALVAAAALAAAHGAAASRLAAALATEVRDPKLSCVLRVQASSARLEPLVGEWAPAPRGTVATIVMSLTGVSLVLHASRLLARLALAHRRPAEVLLSEDGSVRIKWRVELLGRTLTERDVLLRPPGLGRAAREVRYPRLLLYAALLALVAGSYVGVRALVDGVRAGSTSLIAMGLLAIAVGLALDLALTSIAPGARGRCRVLFVPRAGAAVCVGAVDVASADAMLARLAGNLSAPAPPTAEAQRPSDDSMRSPSTASSRPADA
jgi:hypothetical protein